MSYVPVMHQHCTNLVTLHRPAKRYFPCYGFEGWVSERLSDFPKVTQLTEVEAGLTLCSPWPVLSPYPSPKLPVPYLPSPLPCASQGSWDGSL